MTLGASLDSAGDVPHRRGATTARISSIAPLSSTEEVPVAATDPLAIALAAARTGDEGAFATLWRDLHPRLLRYLQVCGNDGPEDLAAETWLQVVRGLSTFEGGVPEFRAWIFTIARHRAIDQGRARSRGLTLVTAADPVEAGGKESTAPSAEEEATTNADTAAALRLVASLPPAQAEMVMLRVVAGLDVADVARLVGKRPGAVRVAVHRALKSLSHTLSAEHGGGER